MGMALGLSTSIGCVCENIFQDKCELGCETWGDDCGEDGQHCAFYCDDEVYAGAVAGCTTDFVEGDFGIPLDQMCAIVTDCIEVDAEQYK